MDLKSWLYSITNTAKPDTSVTPESTDPVTALVTKLNAFTDEKIIETRQATRRKKFLFAVLFLGVGINLVVAINKALPEGMAAAEAAVVRVNGQIAPGEPASLERLSPLLKQAFEDENAACVVLLINSPGGTVTQSQLIHDKVLKLAAKHHKKVIAVAEDLMASGGYMIASAAERIYAPTTAMVGSIGVIRPGYDLSGLADKLGIKDRTYTAGRLKDPFNPLVKPTAEAEAKAVELMTDLHQNFIGMVKAGRGDRLKGADDELFTGEYWTGRKAQALGLTDGSLDIDEAIQADCGAEKWKLYEPKFQPSDVLKALRF